MRKSFSIHLVSGSLAGEPCALNGASTVRGTHGLRNEMHFATKDLQITLRCIHLLSGKAAPSHHCHQISAVNNPAAEADSCKTVISLRIPWAGGADRKGRKYLAGGLLYHTTGEIWVRLLLPGNGMEHAAGIRGHEQGQERANTRRRTRGHPGSDRVHLQPVWSGHLS